WFPTCVLLAKAGVVRSSTRSEAEDLKQSVAVRGFHCLHPRTRGRAGVRGRLTPSETGRRRHGQPGRPNCHAYRGLARGNRRAYGAGLMLTFGTLGFRPDFNLNSEVWTRPRPRRRPSSSMRRRFLQRKEPDCSAIILFRYSDCETSGFPRTRTTTSTRRSPQFRSFRTSDDPFVAAVNRNLRSRCLGEARTTQFCNDLSNVAACDLGSEDIIRFVLLDRNPVTGGPLLQDFLCPDPRVEHSVRVNRVNTNPVDSPFERSDTGQLSQSSLRSRVGGLTNTRSRHVLRCIDHDPPSLGSQSEKLMRKPE